ncbi:MAG: F0F1 ATP synthase subunit B [Bacteroidales bacterium]|nr:F0F1 ATP synthase subunit B [Bacteroidales bacterium]MBO5074191.1 F0F1 ATP synthase subunit B [Bacteroidales bacterium]MBQ8573294.1 F0F1 ATP synthase subunit B [Bacteroidales bacterium]
MDLMLPDSGLLFWMTIIFAIVFFILAKFGFPIITGMVEKRNKRIDDALSAARVAEEALERLSQEQERILSETRTEQAQMLQEAASQRDAMIARAREDARLQADALIKEAKERINEEKEAALRDVRREVALMSISIAEKVVRKEMSSEKGQKEFIDRMVAEMLDNEKTSSSEAVN